MGKKTVKIDEDIYTLLAERAEEKDFDDTDEYVHYVLDQVADKIRRKKGRDKEGFSKEDEEKVKERLRGLGYLD
ncbi:MAG: CopG family transcriptional regulator [Candidatus Nanohaloarchaea archaeon]|nr:CopG family transcriptional regulator [Candidatus Nanohaloarchaea archaeon]